MVRRGAWTMAFGVVAVATLAMTACAGSDSDDVATTTETSTAPKETTTTTTAPVTSADLTGSFTSTSVGGHDLVAGSTLTLSFEDDQLTASAGCNTMGSAFSLDGGILLWEGEPRSTMMACSDELMAQDTWLTGLLTGGVHASLDGDTLTLAAQQVTMTLERSASTPLTDTVWLLEGTIEDGTTSSLPESDDPPSLTIDEAGNASVTTGCNTGSASVVVDEATLTFGVMRLTKMACTDDPAAAVEAAITAVLVGQVDYTVDGDALTITNGTAGLSFRAR